MEMRIEGLRSKTWGETLVGILRINVWCLIDCELVEDKNQSYKLLFSLPINFWYNQ